MHREYIRETKVYGAEANSMDREMAYSCCKFSCSDLKHTSASHTVELMTDIFACQLTIGVYCEYFEPVVRLPVDSSQKQATLTLVYT